jgi:hypothetical protein
VAADAPNICVNRVRAGNCQLCSFAKGEDADRLPWPKTAIFSPTTGRASCRDGPPHRSKVGREKHRDGPWSWQRPQVFRGNRACRERSCPGLGRGPFRRRGSSMHPQARCPAALGRLHPLGPPGQTHAARRQRLCGRARARRRGQSRPAHNHGSGTRGFSSVDWARLRMAPMER